ncbi:MAG: hypothetical protein M3313_06880 [Actinomycetota bacterium]|nr:hypothetical protein [Actinomycetota bacterium]
MGAAGFVLLVADPAAAHVGNSPAADNYSGAVTSVEPSLPEGISVEIIAFGSRLWLSNLSDEVVSVPGYSGEPYLEIGPDGVRRNQNSPTTYINLGGPGTAALPDRADPTAEPSWEIVSSEPEYEWSDHRTHWTRAQLPPDVLADPGSAHRIMEWTIPLEIGSTTYDVSGVLDWTPPPPTWLPYLVVVAVAGVGVFVCWIRRSSTLATGLLLLGCMASVWHLASTPLPRGSTSSVIYGLLGVSVPTVAILVLTVFAVRAVHRQSGAKPWNSAPYLFGLAGWLLIAEAFPDLDVLFRANVSAIGPAWAARAAVLLLLGLGLGLALGSFGLLRARSLTRLDRAHDAVAGSAQSGSAVDQPTVQ